MKALNAVRGFFRALPARLGRALDGHPVIFTASLAFLLTLVIEMASRHSPVKGVVFLFIHPLNFLTGMLIVLSTISLANLFKKRVFWMTLLSGLWLAAGIINAVVLAFRVTPFGIVDLSLLPSVFTIFTVYLEIWQIVLLAVILVAVIAGLVVLFIKSGKLPVHLRAAAVLIAGSVLLAVGAYSLTVVGHEEEREDTFSNIADAYSDYGFVYCFATGALDRGVSRPDFYSRSAVNWLVGNLKESSAPAIRPNIIFVQLESFFDVGYLDDVEYDENPIPNFVKLRDEYTSGFLTVPSVGAGTANTEFEVLSGMSLDFMGMGEYPYNTILRDQACETAVWDLKSLGYTGTAIHNNTAIFYGRNEVFAQLGFDSFIPIEYMDNVEYNPIGWCRDQILTHEILKAMDATPGQDFVFTITVQGHGKYQRGVDSEDADNPDITWTADPEDENAFAYYMSQLSETDEFIGDLVSALSQRAEPTVLVLYGDHLPSFPIGSEQLANGDIFETEYVMWSNMRLPEEDEDLSAYQLYSKVLEDLGMSPGLITRYHQQMWDTEDYREGLNLLEYDMLNGDYYCYGGENPFEATDLQMGVEPVVITGVRMDENGLLHVTGDNFTDWSVIALNGDNLDTWREGKNELVAVSDLTDPDRFPEEGMILTVRQATGEGLTLSESVGVVLRQPLVPEGE